MKQNKKELEFDIIGGEGPLTKDEENAISEFILSQSTSEKGK